MLATGCEDEQERDGVTNKTSQKATGRTVPKECSVREFWKEGTGKVAGRGLSEESSLNNEEIVTSTKKTTNVVDARYYSKGREGGPGEGKDRKGKNSLEGWLQSWKKNQEGRTERESQERRKGEGKGNSEKERKEGTEKGNRVKEEDRKER